MRDCSETIKSNEKKAGPLVTVLIPTYNRRRYLPVALASVVRQDYDNLEIFVIRDGGEQVGDIVSSFNDSRIVFIDRAENRGVAFTLNEALVRAQGKYICYLGDDDLYYPHHVSTLLDALENGGDYEVAYSDLYKTYCRIGPDGSREALSKIVEISRDFDRFFMLYFNHALHVSLMHRADLMEKIGLYNEQLNVMIDWDLTRRLVFFSDFHHIHEITGEFYSPVGQSDRISVQRRKDQNEYRRNVLTIRTTRPAKPWSKIDDMSIIFVADKLSKQTGQTIGLIWSNTFYPYRLYLPLSHSELSRLTTDMPNVVFVPVNPLSSQDQKIDAALAECDGKYVAIVPSGLPIEEMWVEHPLYALINSAPMLPCESENGGVAFEMRGSTEQLWAIVVTKEQLQNARKNFPDLSVRQSLQAAGIQFKKPTDEQMPFQFDLLLQQAQSAENNGNWAQAAQMFEYIAEHYQNKLWMKTLSAKASYKVGNHTRAAKLCSEINQQRPTVNTLLLEAKVDRGKKNFKAAITLLRRAEQILTRESDYLISNEVNNYSR
jgi:glycosyltransferase involved in cell wall biosynthesis